MILVLSEATVKKLACFDDRLCGSGSHKVRPSNAVRHFPMQLRSLAVLQQKYTSYD